MATPDHSWADLPCDTPYLALDPLRVRNAHDRLRAALPQTELFYAMKANPAVSLLRLLDGLGCGFVIASHGELEILESVRVPNDLRRVLYSNPVKPRDHIARTYALNVRQYAVDGLAELHKLADTAPKSAVYYRLRTRAGESAVPSEGKFGATVDEIIDLIEVTKALDLIPYGITFHVGSQQPNAVAWVSAISDVAEVLERMFHANNFRLRVLDIGGGFPVPYVGTQADIADIGEKIRYRLHSLPYVIKTIAEPGRFLVAEAGIMAATVLGVVRRGDTTWVHLDVGAFNGFMESLETGGKLWYPVSDSRGGETMRVSLAGPTCDSQDPILHNVAVSRGLREGDRVFIHNAGAYTTVYATARFNGFLPPQTYVVGTDYSPPGDLHEAHPVRRPARGAAPAGRPHSHRR